MCGVAHSWQQRLRKRVLAKFFVPSSLPQPRSEQSARGFLLELCWVLPARSLEKAPTETDFKKTGKAFELLLGNDGERLRYTPPSALQSERKRPGGASDETRHDPRVKAPGLL